MNGKKSRTALLEFLDYLGEKGLMASGTVTARKAACGKLLGILSEDEAEDITILDLEDVVLRFQNLEGKNYTPGSLKTYLSRTTRAVDDFKSYLKSPLAFRPDLKPRNTKSKSKQQQAPASSSPVSENPHQPSTTNAEPSRVADTIIPIPIRPNTVVHVQGLPFDLSEQEANKIAAVVKAMALIE